MEIILIIIGIIIFLYIININPKKKKNKNEIKGTICKSKSGIEVKSKGEKFIADYFLKNNYKFEYEKPLIIKGKKVSKPDFYLNDYDVYVEFWGGYGNKEYDKIRKFKIKKYKSYNIKFISLYPGSLEDITELLKLKLEDYPKINK